MGARGGAVRRLTRKGSNAFPAWSPDGKRIVFVSDRDGNLELYVMNADGSGQTRLTRNPAVDGSPAWSRDGHSIACGCEHGGNFDIYLLTVLGEGAKRLTRDDAIEADPSWSQDREIAYERKSEGVSEIYVVDLEIGEHRRLTSGGDPAWSPDSRRIAFVRDGDIYLIDPDGRRLRKLTRGPGDDEFPGWLP
jgi:Tol biopolymer transport system component